MHWIWQSGCVVLVWQIGSGRRKSVSEIIEEGTKMLTNAATAELSRNASNPNLLKEPIEPLLYSAAFLAIKPVEELVSPCSGF